MQAWYDQWLAEHKDPANDLIYSKNSRGEPTLNQVHFVRDDLSSVFWADRPYAERSQEPEPRIDCKETCYVIGEHRSKSVRLPVFSLERADLGIQFVMRFNYYDWNVSVISERPIVTDLRGFVLDFSDDDRKRHPGGYRYGSWGYCYFQGFPEDKQFGPYVGKAGSTRKFSTYMTTNYQLYTFVYLIMRDLHRAKT